MRQRMQTTNDGIFSLRYREACVPPYLSQGTSSQWGNSMNNHRAFPTRKWVSKMASARPLPDVFIIQLSKNVVVLIPSGTP